MALKAGYYGVKKSLTGIIASLAGAKVIKSVGNGLSLSNAGDLAANIDADTMEFKDGKLSSKGGSAITYSTDEQKTGDKWIDGRDIYQKTFIFTGITGTSTYRSDKLNLDIDLAIEATGRIKLGSSGGSNWCTAPYIETASYYCGLTYQGGSNDCIVCSAGNWGLTDAEVTLKYVKVLVN